MRRMFSEKQIKEFIQYLSTDIAQQQISALAVRKIPAPESTTLTDEEIALIQDGVFIEGEFLNFKNPVLFPAGESATLIRGIIICTNATAGASMLGCYSINKSAKTISVLQNTIPQVNLQSINQFNGKSVPSYPANTGTFVLKCVDGVLTWVEEV